jgi:hypothetical protein
MHGYEVISRLIKIRVFEWASSSISSLDPIILFETGRYLYRRNDAAGTERRD